MLGSMQRCCSNLVSFRGVFSRKAVRSEVRKRRSPLDQCMSAMYGTFLGKIPLQVTHISAVQFVCIANNSQFLATQQLNQRTFPQSRFTTRAHVCSVQAIVASINVIKHKKWVSMCTETPEMPPRNANTVGLLTHLELKIVCGSRWLIVISPGRI